MNDQLLDNPGWHALNSHHQHLAVREGFAARYPPDISMGVALMENRLPAFKDLGNLVEAGENIFVVGSIPEDLEGWDILLSEHPPQMVCDELNPRSAVDATECTEKDVPEMLELVALTQPGPFLPRTIEMGRYIGLRRGGQLVAMAGERLHLTGYCEISAVCTHPDHRGRGFAGALTSMVAQNIIARGEIPFLHVRSDNEAAIKLYQKLGFRKRTHIHLSLLKKRSWSAPVQPGVSSIPGFAQGTESRLSKDGSPYPSNP